MIKRQDRRIYPSIRYEMCGEKVAEPKARVKDGKIVCIPCFEGIEFCDIMKA